MIFHFPLMNQQSKKTKTKKVGDNNVCAHVHDCEANHSLYSYICSFSLFLFWKGDVKMMLFTNAVLKELLKLIWILNNIHNTASPLIKRKGIKIKEHHVQRKLSSLFARKIKIIVEVAVFLQKHPTKFQVRLVINLKWPLDVCSSSKLTTAGWTVFFFFTVHPGISAVQFWLVVLCANLDLFEYLSWQYFPSNSKYCWCFCFVPPKDWLLFKAKAVFHKIATADKAL